MSPSRERHSAAGDAGLVKQPPPVHVPPPIAGVQVSAFVPQAKACFAPPLLAQLVVPGVKRIE